MATTKSSSLIRSSIDLDTETREEMCALLNDSLADMADLHSQAKQAHWNVKGPGFIELHKLYDMLAGEITPHIDAIAERVTALGGLATGTVRMAAASTRLPEFPEGAVGDMESVELLVERFAAVAKSTRDAIDTADEAGDMVTADLFTQIGGDLDKWLWFLEAHIQPAGK